MAEKTGIEASGSTSKGGWYNPIGITLKAGSDGARTLEATLARVKAIIKDTEGLDKYDLESPSNFAKALCQFVLNSEVAE